MYYLSETYTQSTVDKVAARNSQELATLGPKTRAKAIDFLKDVYDRYRLLLLITDGGRTYAEQKAIYSQGRTLPGKQVTKAQAGYSWHNFKRAFDMVPIDGSGAADWDSTSWAKIGALARAHGLSWGGSFGDKPHMSNKEGTTLAILRAKYPSWQSHQVIQINPATGTIIPPTEQPKDRPEPRGFDPLGRFGLMPNLTRLQRNVVGGVALVGTGFLVRGIYLSLRR